MERLLEFVIFHHAENARGKNKEDVSEAYPTITKKGEKWAREQSSLILFKRISEAPKDSAVVFCGVSRLGRTQETLAVLTSELYHQCAVAVKKLSGLTIIESLVIVEEFLASSDQQDNIKIALDMLNGLKRLEARFKHILKKNLFLVCVGHAREMEALINLPVDDRMCEAALTFIL